MCYLHLINILRISASHLGPAFVIDQKYSEACWALFQINEMSALCPPFLDRSKCSRMWSWRPLRYPLPFSALSVCLTNRSKSRVIHLRSDAPPQRIIDEDGVGWPCKVMLNPARFSSETFDCHQQPSFVLARNAVHVRVSLRTAQTIFDL